MDKPRIADRLCSRAMEERPDPTVLSRGCWEEVEAGGGAQASSSAGQFPSCRSQGTDVVSNSLEAPEDVYPGLMCA